MSWRPKNWNNPYFHQVDEEEAGDFGWLVEDKVKAYEDGADAMLKYIKENINDLIEVDDSGNVEFKEDL